MPTFFAANSCRKRGLVLSLLLCLATASFATPLPAQEPGRNPLVFQVSSKTSSLSMTEKEARLIELPARIKTVDSFDPTVIKITTVDNFSQVRVLALTSGFTSIVMVDERGQTFKIDVLVSGDVRQLEAIIRETAPSSSVRAIKVKDSSVMLLGWVDQAGQATQIVELAEQFHPKVLNYLKVSGVQTIMLRVRMMEAQRSRIRALGFNFLQLRDHSYAGSMIGGVSPFANQTPTNNLANPFGGFLGPVSSAVNPAAASAVFGLVANDNAFQGFIEALKQENLLTILSEPNLITTNGRPANFLAGGQFPVPIPQGLGTVSVQYKPFGVQLEFVPIIVSNGRLRMQVKPEVSEKDLSNTVTVNGITVPSLTTRMVNTEVEMNFGQTLVVAGLISNRIQARTVKVPFLGELPWIGAAFRRVSHDEAETELLVLVTPELVSPVDEAELPDGPGRGTVAPTDRELFFNGYLETPRYAPDPEVDYGMNRSATMMPANDLPPYEPTSVKDNRVSPPPSTGATTEPYVEPVQGLAKPSTSPAEESTTGATSARKKKPLKPALAQSKKLSPVRQTAKAGNDGRPSKLNGPSSRSNAVSPASYNDPASSRETPARPGLIAP